MPSPHKAAGKGKGGVPGQSPSSQEHTTLQSHKGPSQLVPDLQGAGVGKWLVLPIPVAGGFSTHHQPHYSERDPSSTSTEQLQLTCVPCAASGKGYGKLTASC